MNRPGSAPVVFSNTNMSLKGGEGRMGLDRAQGVEIGRG